jgi:hypothetical protein
MNNALSIDVRRHRTPVGELTTTRPPPNAERVARWYAKALPLPDYPLMSGPRWGLIGREYERQEMLDAREREIPW